MSESPRKSLVEAKVKDEGIVDPRISERSRSPSDFRSKIERSTSIPRESSAAFESPQSQNVPEAIRGKLAETMNQCLLQFADRLMSKVESDKLDDRTK